MDFRLQSASPLENTASEWRCYLGFFPMEKVIVPLNADGRDKRKMVGLPQHASFSVKYGQSSEICEKFFSYASKARSGMKVSLFVAHSL